MRIPLSSVAAISVMTVAASPAEVAGGAEVLRELETEVEETEVYFTFDLAVDGICTDGADKTFIPDTKARLEEGCLNWVQEMADLDREELEARDSRRDSEDDFLDLFLIEDLDVVVMVNTEFVDGSSCRIKEGGRELQRRQQSTGSFSGKAKCRWCRRKVISENRLLHMFLGDPESRNVEVEGEARHLQASGNLTASLIEAGFEDAKNVSFSNFFIKDCSESSPDCSGETDDYACCGSTGCKCMYSSETLCAEEQCGIDGLCCGPDPMSEASFLYPQCADSEACTSSRAGGMNTIGTMKGLYVVLLVSYFVLG